MSTRKPSPLTDLGALVVALVVALACTLGILGAFCWVVTR